MRGSRGCRTCWRHCASRRRRILVELRSILACPSTGNIGTIRQGISAASGGRSRSNSQPRSRRGCRRRRGIGNHQSGPVYVKRESSRRDILYRQFRQFHVVWKFHIFPDCVTSPWWLRCLYVLYPRTLGRWFCFNRTELLPFCSIELSQSICIQAKIVEFEVVCIAHWDDRPRADARRAKQRRVDGGTRE